MGEPVCGRQGNRREELSVRRALGSTTAAGRRSTSARTSSLTTTRSHRGWSGRPTTPGAGAFYPITHTDRDGQYLTGDHNYRLHLPPNPPAKLFWSVTVYDAANSSGLDNGQPLPSLNSLDKPVVNADGSIDLYFGEQAPAPTEKNWLRTPNIAPVAVGDGIMPAAPYDAGGGP